MAAFTNKSNWVTPFCSDRDKLEWAICWSRWSLTERVNERERSVWLAAFSPSGRRLIDFSGLEPRLCPYWSIIPSPVSPPIKSSLSRHYGPLLMNTTFLPTSQCVHCAACLWCFLTSFLTIACYSFIPAVDNAQSHLNNNRGIYLELRWASFFLTFKVSKGIPQFIKHEPGEKVQISVHHWESIASPAARF